MARACVKHVEDSCGSCSQVLLRSGYGSSRLCRHKNITGIVPSSRRFHIASIAFLFSARTRTDFCPKIAFKIMLAIVWDLPVPGGPWTRSSGQPARVSVITSSWKVINDQMAGCSCPSRAILRAQTGVFGSPRFGGEIAVACQDQAVEGSMCKQFRVMLGIEAASHGASRLIENARTERSSRPAIRG